MTTGWRSWAGAERFQGRRFQGRRFQGRAVPLLITMWGPSAVSRTLPSPHAVITVGPVEIAGSSAATRHQPFGSDPPPSTSSTPRHTLYPLHTLHIRACSADDPTSRRADEPTSRRADEPTTMIKSCGHLPSPYDTKRPQTLITGIGRPETPSALTPLGHLPEDIHVGRPRSRHHTLPTLEMINLDRTPGRTTGRTSPGTITTPRWPRGDHRRRVAGCVLGQHAYRDPRPTTAGRDRWCSHARGRADGSGRSTANGAQRQTALKR